MANCYDIIRAVAVVLGFGYCARQDRKTWLWAESVLWGYYTAATFVCPETFLPSTTSDMMCYLVRMWCSMMAGQELMWFLCRKSRDENVIGAMLWSRVMNCLILMLVFGYTYLNHADKFDDKNHYFEGTAMAMMLLTTVYRFWVGGYHVGGREQRGHISTILRINFLILFFTGLVDLTFPSWVIPFKKLSAMEVFMMRNIGAVFFGWSFTAWYATSFRYDEDRSAFFLSEFMAIVGMFISLNLSIFMDGLYTPREALVMHLGILPSFLVLLGLYLLRKKKEESNSYATSSYFLRSKTE